MTDPKGNTINPLMFTTVVKPIHILDKTNTRILHACINECDHTPTVS